MKYPLDKYTNNDDQNNPWNIASTYNSILEDGSIDSKPFIIQKPNEDTNMFADYRTALLAMYLPLIGTVCLKILQNPSFHVLFLFLFLFFFYLKKLIYYR